LETFKFSNIVKTIASDGDLPEYKIYDLKYYEDEFDKFEGWFLGEITIGNLRMSKKIVKSDDRFSKTKHCDENFTMITRVVCVDNEPFATIAMVHGFAENSMVSLFETAMHHALNGFDVYLADMKGYGYSSGCRGAMYCVQDWHENIGVLI
jgi:pimeloyl-ACP methyl ester carboxylesterase